MDVAVAAEKSCERGAMPVCKTHCEFLFKSRRCTCTLTSSAQADNWNHRERPRWRDRSALQHINPTGSNLHGDYGDVFACTFCWMFVFLTFGPRVARESSRVIEARPTLCIVTPYIYSQSAQPHPQPSACARVVKWPPPPLSFVTLTCCARMHALSLLSTSSSCPHFPGTKCRREESPLEAKQQIAHLDVRHQLIGGSTMFFGCFCHEKNKKER